MNKPNKMPEGYYGWSLVDGVEGANLLRDQLQHLALGDELDSQQAQGILIGVATSLMAGGMLYEDALQLTWQLSPSNCDFNRIPEAWRGYWATKIASQTTDVTL